MNNKIKNLVSLLSIVLVLLVVPIILSACGSDITAVTSVSINGSNSAIRHSLIITIRG